MTIRAIAIGLSDALGCAGMARVDVFLAADNEVVIGRLIRCGLQYQYYVSKNSWQASGLGYTDLISRLIELALERHTANNAA